MVNLKENKIHLLYKERRKVMKKKKKLMTY
jgi:hypothetical protein